MDGKKYLITRLGDGSSPHILTNSEDETDVLALCSCGGTKNPQGLCDGSHRQKKESNCLCAFCRKI